MFEMLIVEHRRNNEVIRASWYATVNELEVLTEFKNLKQILNIGWIPCSSQLIKEDVFMTMFKRLYKE